MVDTLGNEEDIPIGRTATDRHQGLVAEEKTVELKAFPSRRLNADSICAESGFNHSWVWQRLPACSSSMIFLSIRHACLGWINGCGIEQPANKKGQRKRRPFYFQLRPLM
ncbi:hypothetical protein [Pseudomonas piscis]|uniref:hypothetical protein n=1 Tax=Pseudomonas piscis TaxID=2614538 RepID=UPI001FE3297C|nr:hypothetical protein [Pseudomonas piscis]